MLINRIQSSSECSCFYIAISTSTPLSYAFIVANSFVELICRWQLWSNSDSQLTRYHHPRRYRSCRTPPALNRAAPERSTSPNSAPANNTTAPSAATKQPQSSGVELRAKWSSDRSVGPPSALNRSSFPMVLRSVVHIVFESRGLLGIARAWISCTLRRIHHRSCTGMWMRGVLLLVFRRLRHLRGVWQRSGCS